MSAQEFHIEITQPDETAVDVLAAGSGLSKQLVKQAMHKGAVWLTRGKHTRRLRRATRTLNTGDTLHLYYDEQVLAEQPGDAILVADEGSYSAWYKPRGMLSQGSKWGDHCSIARWVSQHLEPERPAFIVHRLDRATSGLVLVAHTKTMTRALAALFQQREITKHYEAIVHGHFPASPAVTTIDTPLDGKPAMSHARLLAYDGDSDRSLVDIRIETGRKHQVRRHLAGLGFPVLGDRRYGPADPAPGDLQLTAVSLAFTCPDTGQPRHYELDADLRPAL